MEESDYIEDGVPDNLRLNRKRIMDQRSGAALKKKWEQGDRIALEEKSQMSAPPEISIGQCHVCQSPHREWIENAIMKGTSYARIAQKITDEKGEPLDRRSVSSHYRKGHMNLQREEIRAELEEEAALLKQNVDDGTLGAKTDRGILKVLVSKGFDDVITGVSSVEPKDLIQIIKLLNELNSNVESSRASENEVSLRTFVRAIENVLGDKPELIRGIVEEAERIRKLDDVDFAMEGILIHPRQAIEATSFEVTDDEV